MINFSGYMYNMTSEEWLGLQPDYYSLGYYMGSDLIPGTDDGTTKTIPRADISYNLATNIGVYFEQYAKAYYIDHAEYPVLRLYKTKTEKSYIEWNPINPDSLVIHTENGDFAWVHVYHWESDPATFVKPSIFVSTEVIADLTAGNVIWSGSVRDNDAQDPTAYISYTNAFINMDPSVFVQVNAGDFLAYMQGWNRTFVSVGLAYACFIVSSTWYDGPALVVPATGRWDDAQPPYSGAYTVNGSIKYPRTVIESKGVRFRCNFEYWDLYNPSTDSTPLPIHYSDLNGPDAVAALLNDTIFNYGYMQEYLYLYLTDNSKPAPVEPPSDVDPDDIPPADEPPTPIVPDDPDPYYDPTSDPDSPDYEPDKDPTSPDYDPDVPHTPFRPVSGESPDPNPNPLPPEDTVPVPPQPPVFASSNRLLTLYNPVQSELNDLADFLWSPTWSVDTFKKIFANPLDAILGLMVMPTLPATVSQRELSIGNIPTGITMRYFTQQFVDFPCGSFAISEYYGSYLDYAPYTKVVLMLPYIGECRLNTDEVMNKTVDVTYRFDVSTGTCVAFVKVDGSLLYTFNGMAVASIPVSANGWGSMISGLISMPIKAVAAGAALGAGPVGVMGAAAATSVMSMKEEISHTGNLTGSAGLMGIQKPYLIITRPRQVIPASQNSYTGYPSFITESLGSLSGYTEVEQCHLEHVPATGEELAEIERLLKEGVLF